MGLLFFEFVVRRRFEEQAKSNFNVLRFFYHNPGQPVGGNPELPLLGGLIFPLAVPNSTA